MPESIQDVIMQSVLLILNEKDQEKFAKLQDGYFKRYSLVAPRFVRYFQDNYMS